MKKIYYLFKHKHLIPLFVILVLGFLAARSLIFQEGYFNMHDDLQMMRQLQMEKCILDGQIPCRWVPDMGYGYGFPLFNFYPPFPYLMGELFRLLGFSFITTIKLNFAFALVASGMAMYFLAREFFGRAGAVLSSIFYTWAPYHAVEIYVRGAMNENWALVFFPLIFLFSYKLVRSERKLLYKWLIGLTLSLFGLLTSHNLMVIIFAPFFAIWIIILLFIYKHKKLPYLILSGIWALGMSAFFTFPALAENGFTHLKSQLTGYFEYSAHFVTLKQLLFSRYWGYGGSAWETDNDAMSFSIGHLHWILSMFIGAIAVPKILALKINGLRHKNLLDSLRRHPVLIVTAFLFLSGWAAAYLTHGRSTPIYLAIPQIQFIQFPWRFLTIVIFSFSFLVGVIPKIFINIKNIKLPFFGFLLKSFGLFSQILIVFLLTLVIVILNWNYFEPKGGKMGPLTDEEKFSGVAWELQQAAGAMDYLPIAAKKVPSEFKSSVADVMSGNAQIIEPSSGSYWSLFKISADEETTIRINTYYFPGWRVFIKEGLNNVEVPVYVPEEEEFGRMWVDLPAGQHLVFTQILNTPVRTWSNIISIISWLALIGFLMRRHIILGLFRQS